MKEQTSTSTIHNVIILDKSGSMSSIRRQAVDGVNETLAGIRSQAEKTPEQRQLVTLVAFCGCEMKRLYIDTPIDQVRDLKPEDYRPCCMTPLYDAIGSTIVPLHRTIADDRRQLASITVITDGYENASREYRHSDITRLINQYKEEGWLFAYIGADHDVEAVAYSLSIDNALEFEKTDRGTRGMFAKLNRSKSRWFNCMSSLMAEEDLDDEERIDKIKSSNIEFFVDDEM